MATLGDGDDTFTVAADLTSAARLSGGPGNDVLDGGAGSDSVGFEDHKGAMTLDLPAHTTSEGDTISSLETIRLGPGAATVTGTAAGEFITAGTGANRIDGGGDDDLIFGAPEVSIETSCPSYVVGRCRGVIELRDRGRRLLGRRAYRTSVGETIDVALNAAGRAALTKGRHTIAVRARGGDGTGGSATVARSYRITVP